MALIDREAQVEVLRRLAADSERRMALLYGRRRIGKTYLLTHAWPSHDVLYFTASATSPEINRRALLREASRWSGEELREEDHPSWRNVFRGIFALREGEQVVVVVDEFQYLATDDAGMREVASELNAVWEGRLHRTGGLLLVLSGSAVHTMQALESGGSPLFGRLDWRHRLEPFDYYDAGRMVSYENRGKVLTYAAFGGTPQYLAAIEGKRSINDNIVDLLLDPGGKVRIQLETALEQEEGLRDPAKYRSILAAAGLKRRTAGEIAAHLNVSNDSGLKRMIKELVRLEYLQEERNFGAPSNQPVRYRNADPAQRFFYGLVLPNISSIASAGAQKVWKDRLAPEAWPSYVGQEVFEDIVEQAYRRHASAQSLPAVEEWGRWQGTDRDGTPTEIDVVARLLDGRLLTGSVKFRARHTGAREWADHVTALERLAAAGQGWAREALRPSSPFLFVSSSGFKSSFAELRKEDPERDVVQWRLDDLY